MVHSIVFIVSLFSLLSTTCLALGSGDYYRRFFGDGTYYGFTTQGNCAIRSPLPAMYSGMMPIAINNAQYAGSASCGACLEVTGYGQGSGANPIVGTFKAYVHDRCPECKYGDIDLSKSGDGRWKVSWKFIPCPAEWVFFLMEGSNRYYMKMQPRGLQTPVQAMRIGSQWGTKTQDNFYIFQDGGGFRFPVQISMRTTMGKWVNVQMTYMKPDGPVYPAGYRTGRSAPPASISAPQPPKPSGGGGGGKCVPNWKPCTGPKNFWGTSNCCSKNYRCVVAGQRNFVGKRCEPNWL